jgi:hypothetical protein
MAGFRLPCQPSHIEAPNKINRSVIMVYILSPMCRALSEEIELIFMIGSWFATPENSVNHKCIGHDQWESNECKNKHNI